MKVRAHVFVSGRVQGVYFRQHTKDEADRVGVNGWVRNLSDGRVEALIEGEKEKVEEMVQICRRGPPSAQVTDINVAFENYTGEFKNFSIRYR
ncbi:MAG: acylphosphatase [Candidatus Freyarchaeum deiterrae]